MNTNRNILAVIATLLLTLPAAAQEVADGAAQVGAGDQSREERRRAYENMSEAEREQVRERIRDNPDAMRERMKSMTPEQRENRRKKFESMTPEQREQMRKRFRSGGSHAGRGGKSRQPETEY